ncbi:MAG TPA: YceI family protein [Methylomirabilota bacterium]|nr:YceI family protein [Methylomirabilota bacterium]
MTTSRGVIPFARSISPPRAGRRHRGAQAWTAWIAASAILLGHGAAWGATLRVDPERTRLAVQLHREGLGSRLAHDHVVEATEVAGRVEYDASRPEASSVVVEVRAASLRVDEPAARRRLGVEGDLSDSQRADVDKAMRGPDQLDVPRYPTIRFASTRVVTEGNGRLRISGRLTLRGVTRELTFPAAVALDSGALRARATLTFLQSSFGYRPYSALLGAIRNRDEVTLHVDLVAVP